MTLHETTILIRKAGIGSAIGVSIIILIVILIRVGISIKNSMYPPIKDPPTQSFGILPPLQFPESTVKNNNFTYTLQTTTGQLPTDLPDRLNVFTILESTPNFLNLNKAKMKVSSLGFTNKDGSVVPEIQLANPYYEWNETKDFNRKIVININSFNFKMTSSFLSSLTPLSAKYITNEQDAIDEALDFLSTAGLRPDDLDLIKTTTPKNTEHFVTYPKLFSIQNGPEGNFLTQTTSLSKTQVIRVDVYQKDVEYDLNTGSVDTNSQKPHMKLPILYPYPPYSIMSFWLTSGIRGLEVTQAFFTHKEIDFNKADNLGNKIDATYPIKTPEEAYAYLSEGKAYIASYEGQNNNILIKDVFLGYYLAEDTQGYLLPIYVFEGNDGFFAYVPALAETENIPGN